MSENKVLGKRKQREDGAQPVSGSTFFVSNLPYSATSTDLQTLFSDLAPVRSAFVVLSDNVSKGVGYVAFALKEDAQTAMETIEKDGLKLNGRALRVQWADHKVQTNGEKDSKTEKPPRTKTPTRREHPVAKVDKDPDAIRTVVISGLASNVDKKTLWKKIRKLTGAERIEMDENSDGSAFAVFSTPVDASHAVEKLHAHVFKGLILSATLKRRVEALAKVTNGTISPNRGSRLIVRNVPWNITERDIRALFLPYGPIYSITIPKVPSDSEEPGKKQKSRGFVFVWFFSKKDADNAIEGVNGREVVAGAVLAPTMNKKERARQRRKARNAAMTEADDSEEEDSEATEDEEDERAQVPKTEGRVLAVDWALSKDKWEKAKDEQMNEDHVTHAEDSISSSAEVSESDSSDAESNESGAEDEEHASDNDERSDAEEAGKPMLPQTDVGTTVFVRNVPFEATEDELRVLFRAFGPLRYARITVDAETGRSRGTGFVCFWNQEDAGTAIQQAEFLNREALASPSGSASLKAKNPFSLPSLLTPDPSSSLAQSLVLHGRTLSVTRAVTREDASRLKDEGERAREKADKRNLYLLREGVIFPNSPAASSIRASELEKRNASFSARRNLLKSNPSLYVSKTRLSIRQLPLFVSDRALKRLGIHAVRVFEEEAKGGSRQPITADELFADREMAVDGDEDAAKATARKRKKGERETGVKQAKVIRQTDRVDPTTGKGRSRGYGFLEMNRHSDALRVLRWANNNKVLGPLFQEWWKAELREMINAVENAGSEGKTDDDGQARLKRLRHELERSENVDGTKGGKTLIVEFSIENTQVVKRRKEKIEVSRISKSEKRANGQDGDDSSDRRPQKKARVSSEQFSSTGKAAPVSAREDAGTQLKETAPAKQANPLGSMIGRKRKIRKAKGRA